MKIIHDEKKLCSILKRKHFEEIFGKEYAFQLVEFEKDEYINNSMNPRDYLLFPISGICSIFHIHEDGSYYLFSRSSKFTMMGDMEYALPESTQYRILCNTDVLCVALEIQANKKELDQDIVFLHYVMRSLANKVNDAGAEHAEPSNLEERVLFYMHQHDNSIHGVEKCSDRLHCSRRQLQRILISLQKKKKIKKIEKGVYQLI